MRVNKPFIPLTWLLPSDTVCRLLWWPTGEYVWNAICVKGRDPEALHMRYEELGDGRLAVGCFENGTDDLKAPIPGLGFIIPLGFWYTTDGRMPMYWTSTTPPDMYAPPGPKKTASKFAEGYDAWMTYQYGGK